MKYVGDMAAAYEYLDYNRTVIAFHGTNRDAAERLVAGDEFTESEEDDEWLGKGIYFWEYAPRQAWWWARRVKKEKHPAAVGAIIRLGNCLDLLDPANVKDMQRVRSVMRKRMAAQGIELPKNVRSRRREDCAVFNYFYQEAEQAARPIDSARGVFVPRSKARRAWEGSWIYEEAHIQISVRNQRNIFAIWHVREDGRYGKDQEGSD